MFKKKKKENFYFVLFLEQTYSCVQLWLLSKLSHGMIFYFFLHYQKLIKPFLQILICIFSICLILGLQHSRQFVVIWDRFWEAEGAPFLKGPISSVLLLSPIYSRSVFCIWVKTKEAVCPLQEARKWIILWVLS